MAVSARAGAAGARRGIKFAEEVDRERDRAYRKRDNIAADRKCSEAGRDRHALSTGRTNYFAFA